MLKNQKIPNQMLRISVLDFLGVWVHLALGLFRISIFGFRILLSWLPFGVAQDRPWRDKIQNCYPR